MFGREGGGEARLYGKSKENCDETLAGMCSIPRIYVRLSYNELPLVLTDENISIECTVHLGSYGLAVCCCLQDMALIPIEAR